LPHFLAWLGSGRSSSRVRGYSFSRAPSLPGLSVVLPCGLRLRSPAALWPAPRLVDDPAPRVGRAPGVPVWGVAVRGRAGPEPLPRVTPPLLDPPVPDDRPPAPAPRAPWPRRSAPPPDRAEGRPCPLPGRPRAALSRPAPPAPPERAPGLPEPAGRAGRAGRAEGARRFGRGEFGGICRFYVAGHGGLWPPAHWSGCGRDARAPPEVVAHHEHGDHDAHEERGRADTDPAREAAWETATTKQRSKSSSSGVDARCSSSMSLGAIGSSRKRRCTIRRSRRRGARRPGPEAAWAAVSQAASEPLRTPTSQCERDEIPPSLSSEGISS
jgi:hypothetical protein